METKKDLIMQNRLSLSSNKVFIWIAAFTGLILSIPAIAMQFTNEVQWGPEDFTVMTILLFGMGSLFVLVARVIPGKYRALVGVVFLLAMLTIWVHLAVGIVDTWPFAGS